VIEAWQFSLSGNSGTRSEKKSLFCGAQKRQIRPREVLGSHRRQSQQSRLELGLAFQPLIRRDEQSGLLTRIAMESVSLCTPMIS